MPMLCCVLPGLSKSLKLHKDRGDPGEQTPEDSRQGEGGSTKDDSAKPRHQSGSNGSESKRQGPSYKLTGETGSYR